MRPLVRLRVPLMLSCIVSVSLLVGGVAVSAGATKHNKTAHHKAAIMPKIGTLPAPSLFGINTGTYDKSQVKFNRDIPTARGIGARWDHFTSGSVHFFRNGRPNWGVMDYEVTRARRNGLGVLISLGGSPTACSSSSDRANPSGCPPTTTRDLIAYRSFLHAELLRYHNDVQYWESWLEPNNASWWHGQANPGQYANLLRAQYHAFRSFNRTYHTDMKLIFAGPISFSTVPSAGGSMAVLPFVQDVLNDLHGARVFDAIGLHAYRFPQDNSGPADENWGPTAMDWDYIDGLSFSPSRCNGGALWCQMTWPEELQAYEQEFENHGYGQMPLWLTEFGWPGNASSSTALYPSFDTQAHYLAQAYNVLLSLPFIQAAFWFNMRDYQPGIVSPDPPFFYHYGLLRYRFKPKPAGDEFEQLAAANRGR